MGASGLVEIGAGPADGGAAALPQRAPHLGRPMERIEDLALLTGRGEFADDLGGKPGMLHAAILRSPCAHAEILSIDTARALTMPGIRAVLTRDDIQRWSQPFVVGVKQPMQHWPLAVDRVRYAGEPVAVVIAQSRYLAEDALEAIVVEYGHLPAVVEIDAALDPTSNALHAGVGSNIVSERRFSYGEPALEFTAAAHQVTVDVAFPRNSCTPIECGVVLAEHLPMPDGRPSYSVCSNFMGPFSLHAVMAMALQVPGNRLRHRVPRDSGGSFGVKHSVFPYVVLMCLAARKSGAPVKWVEDRLEHLQAATAATARKTRLRAAVTAEGRVTALDYDQVDEVGAYLRAPEPATFYRMHGALTGAYDIRHLTVRNRVVVTNKVPSGLVRGFGGPQVFFALERLMDQIAAELAIDPVELRRRNYVQAHQFPYQAAAGAILDSGDYLRLTNMVMAEATVQELWARRDAARSAGKLYGIGVAAIVEPSISNMGYISTVLTPEQRAKAGPKNGAISSATVAVDLQGGVNVTIASAPAGQGHMTVCAQVVADVLGVDPQTVVVNVEFDTAKDAWSVAAGNYSSRFAGAVAGTVHLAALRLRQKIALIASSQLGCPVEAVVFADGEVRSGLDPLRKQLFTRLAANPHWAPALLPAGVEPGLRETAFWTGETLAAPDAQDRVNTSAAYGFVFDICGLEVDPDTGATRVDRYITGHDAGKLLNPALADGQIRGAFAQGLGAALMETFRYSADGNFLSGTLAEYLMPTACEVPDPVIVHLETPSPFTPLGAKGLGEGNNMSTPVCIANAFADALRGLQGLPTAVPTAVPSTVTSQTRVSAQLIAAAEHSGVAGITLPLTPSRILALIGAVEPVRPGECGPDSGPTAGNPSSQTSIQPSSQPALGLPVAPAALPSLQATGFVEIAATPAEVFAVLLDPAALALVIPGCEKLMPEGPNRFRAQVTIRIALIKARYEAEIELSEIVVPSSLRLSGRGQSGLGTAQGDGHVRLEAITPSGARANELEGATHTRLHYDYQAQVGGKVAAVGPRMLEGAARLVLGELFAALGRQAKLRQPLTHGGSSERAGEGPDSATVDDRRMSSAPLNRQRSWWRRVFEWLVSGGRDAGGRS